MKVIKISYVIVVKNSATNLLKTLESLKYLRQHQKIEIVVIDGNSNDLSPEKIALVRELSDYYISESDTGIYDAMNKGWQNAKGSYIGYINAGDTPVNDGLIKLFDMAEAGADIIYGYTNIVDKNGVFQGRFLCDHNNLPKGTIPHPGTLIRREVYQQLHGFDNTFQIAGDRDFFVRAKIKKFAMRFVDAATVNMEAGGISTKPDVDKENLIIDLKYSGRKRYSILMTYYVYQTKKQLIKILISKKSLTNYLHFTIAIV